MSILPRRKKSIVAGVSVVLVLALCVYLVPALRSIVFGSPPRPNIILIYLDTLRADHLSCYGYHRQTTPHIDRLARQGVLFQRVIAQAPATHASVMSALTSTYACRCYPDASLRNREFATLPEILKNEGYTTVAISSSPVVQAPVQHGIYARGFDRFDDCGGTNGAWRDGSAETVVDRALAFLSEEHAQPFFLLLYIMDPHDPYRSPKKYRSLYTERHENAEAVMERGIQCFYDSYFAWINYSDPGVRQRIRQLREEHPGPARTLRLPDPTVLPRRPIPTDRDIDCLIGLYDGKIRYADDQIARVMNRLDSANAREDTLVILTSDHGEEFYEHSDFGHGRALYQESVRVPLVVSYPAVLPAGGSVQELVQSMDVAPTVLDLLGIDPPDFVDGRSMLPLMTGAGDDWRDYAVTEAPWPWIDAKAIITDRWKYIHHFPIAPEVRGSQEVEELWRKCCEAFRPQHELYDLARDPGETKNVLEAHPVVAKELYERLLGMLPDRELGRLAVGREIEINDHTKKVLRSMGYLK